MRRSSTRPDPDGGSRPLSSLGDVRAFVTVAETRSFSQAAQVLGLSQPTVSQRVQSLESLYGLRLLERRHGMALTAAGREIFNRARLLVSRADELDLLARDLIELKQGHLSIGFSTPHFAMPVIARVLEHHPRLEVDQTLGNTADLLAALQRCRIDVAVTTLDDPPGELRSQLIARQAPMICVPARHPWAERRRLEYAELAGASLVLREPGSMTRALFEASCAAVGVTLGRVMQVPSREAAKEAVVAGLGVGVVLDGETGSDRRLRAVALGDARARGGVYGVSLGEVTGLPTVEAFFAACEAVATRFEADH